MNTAKHATPTDIYLLDFQKQQAAFTATIRNPQHYPAPVGIEERRMNIYRELVYNNIEDLLANFFPVINRILPEKRWHKIVRDFVANHRSRTPIFMKLAGEFVEFLQSEFQREPDDPAYLTELAHYEWTEIALDNSSVEPEWHALNDDNDFLSQAPCVSPLAWSLSYRFPVHRIGPDNPDCEPSDTFLLVYRNTKDDVNFMELNAVAVLLLNKLKDNAQRVTKYSGLQLLQQIASDLQHPNSGAVISGGLQTMQQWYKRDIILGTYR